MSTSTSFGISLPNENFPSSVSTVKPIDLLKSTEKSINNSDKKPEASPPTGFTYKTFLALIGLGFGNFSIGACVSLQAPFFPAEAERKGATASEYGFVFGVYQVSTFLCAPLFGKLIAYVAPYIMGTCGITLVGLAAISFGFLDRAPDKWFIPLAILVRLIEGVGSIAFKTSSYAIIGMQSPEVVTTKFAALETCLGVGLIVGATVGGILYQIGGYPMPFVVVGFLLLADSILMLLVLPKEGGQSRKPGEMIRFWLFWPMFTNFLTIFSVFLFLGVFQACLEPHLRKFHLSPSAVGSIFIITGGLYALLAPILGRFCDRGGNPRILIFTGVLLTAVGLNFIGPTAFIDVETELWMVILGLFIIGTGMPMKLVSTFVICLKQTLERRFPNDLTTYGLVSTLVASSQSTGAFLGPTLGGLSVDQWGFRWTMTYLMLFEIFLFLCLFLQYISTCFKPSADQQPLLFGQVLPAMGRQVNEKTRSFTSSLSFIK